MDLYVLRHGIAAERDGRRYPDDDLRPLTPKGVARMRREAAGMRALGVRPDAIVSSPLVRAMQTAEIARDALGAALSVSEALTPGAHPALLLAELAATRGDGEAVMVVGHEPHLSRLVAFALTGGAEDGLVRLKKGGLCRLRLDGDGGGQLLWALTPGQVRALGARSHA